MLRHTFVVRYKMMKKHKHIGISKTNQYIFSIISVCAVSLSCYLFPHTIGYRIVAYVLLITVSLLAMVFDILPVLMAAVLSSLLWDYLFIPPYFTLRISSVEDTILFFMYFVIALVNAVLTYKIRRAEKKAIMKEEKESTLQLYNTLLNSLSHELRTPIATIIAATDNLQSQTSKLTSQNKYELVSEISKASFRLNQQVENLLNMSRLESGYIHPSLDWCDINEIVYDTVKRLEENNITQRIRININPDIPLFKTDKGMLEQVLYNILNNAAIYTPPHSNIDIIAMCYTDELRIVIEDNGPGFPKEEIAEVFDKFYRLKHSKTGGTGLGLSIVKGFTESLNGRVELKNTSTGGARFVITIPAETSYLKNLKNE